MEVKRLVQLGHEVGVLTEHGVVDGRGAGEAAETAGGGGVAAQQDRGVGAVGVEPQPLGGLVSARDGVAETLAGAAHVADQVPVAALGGDRCQVRDQTADQHGGLGFAEAIDREAAQQGEAAPGGDLPRGAAQHGADGGQREVLGGDVPVEG